MDLTPFQNALSFVLAILGLAVVAAAFAAVLVLLLRGRLDGSDAIKVRDARDPKQTGLPGIPFYVKVGVIRHETSYLETLVTCTLTAVELSLDATGKETAANPLDAVTRTLSWSDAAANQLALLRGHIARAQAAPDPDQQLAHWHEARALLDSLPAYDGSLPAAAPPLASNTLVGGSRVDYARTYYLNATQPLIGSAELSAELASDGTLGKTAVKVQDSTVEKLLGALPVDTFFQSGGGTAAAAAPAGVQESLKRGAAVAYRFTLEMAHSHLRHVFYREVPDFTYRDPIPFNDAGCWYRRETPDAGGKADADAGDAQEKTQEAGA